MPLAHSFRRALVAVLPLAAACHDRNATAPVPVSFDAVRARTRVEPLAKIFDQPIFTSFQGALTYVEPYFRSGTSIPESAKGKTFVYDVPSQSYVIDPAAGGVPAGEVRFVLYAWDGGNGRPATPLTRAGYVDLADVSTGADAPHQVEIIVVREAPRLVAADFVVMHSAANGVNAFGIDGSARTASRWGSSSSTAPRAERPASITSFTT